MGGKSSTTTQQVQIPPEVLARYNAVNARAEQAAGTPFQPYSYNPADFVAQMTPTQLAGIQNINYAAGQAQPYYEEATGQLMGAQQAAVPYYGAAADIYGQAYYGAQPLNQMALQQFYSGLGAAEPLSQQALANLAYGQAQGQQLTGGALSGLGAAQQAAYPYQQMATQYAGAGAAPVSPGYLNTMAYMSPYMQNVISPTMALLNQQNQQAMAGQTANAIRSGAFGGDRAAIAAANLAQQQQLASGKVLGDLLQSGYGQALATAQQQQQLGLSAEQANRAAQAAAAQQFLGIGQQGFGQSLEAARQQQAAAQALFGQGATTAERQAALAQQLYGQQLGVGSATQGLAQQLYQQGMGLGQAQQGVGKELYGMGAGTAQQLAALGQGAQAAALQGAQAQLGAGQAQQQTAQAGLQALYNQYLQQQGYPFQVAQFLANVAMGTGALSGSTTTTNQPGGLFSDERVKENIRRIGKTEDGQPIYAYNYKGDPKEHTQIGLIAQEVEKKHPEAVGLAGGIKTVNYDKATRKSAGLARHDDVIEGEYTAKEGGHVHPEHAGLGFADGGMPYSDPNPTKLDIPDEKPDIQKLELPGKPPGPGRSAMDDVKDAAAVAADVAKIAALFLSTGGRAGYAYGGSPGLVSPADMAALLQAQAQMFGPYSQFNRPMGGAPGGAGFVPQGNLPVSGLAVAKGDLPRQASGLEQAKQIGDVGKSATEIYQAGKKEGWWGKDKDPLQEELKNYGVFARGGLANRHGYAVNGFVEDNPEILTADAPDVGGETTDISGATRKRLIPSSGLDRFNQSLSDLTGILPDRYRDLDLSNRLQGQEFRNYGLVGEKPGLSELQIQEGRIAPEDVVRSVAASQRRAPSAPTGVAPPAARDQVQQFAADISGDQGFATPSAPASPTAERDLGLAPSLQGSTVPGTTVPAGLGAATAPAAKAPAAPGKFNKFLEWARKPENFIPLATGISSTIMAPTRNPLVAAAYGLQSGVQAYQPTLQREAERARTEAQTRQYNVQNIAAAMAIPAGAVIRDSRGVVQGVRVIENGKMVILPYRDYMQRQQQGERFEFAPNIPGVIESAPATAPIGAPAPTAGQPSAPVVAQNAPIYQSLPSDLRQDAQATAAKVMGSDPELLSRQPGANPFDAQAASASIARGTRQQRDQLTRAFVESNPGQSGMFAERISNPFFNWVNSTLTAFGIPNEYLPRSPEDLANQQVVRKITTQLGQTAQAQSGSRAFAEFTALMDAIPTLSNTREGQAKLVAAMYSQAQRDVDLDRFYNLYRNELEQNGLDASLSGVAGRGLESKFSQRQDAMYNTEKEILSKMFLTPITDNKTGVSQPLLSYLIQSGGNIPPSVIKGIRDKFSTKNYDASNIIRYFTGG